MAALAVLALLALLLASMRAVVDGAFTGTWCNVEDPPVGLGRLEISTEGKIGTIRVWTDCDLRYEEVVRLSANTGCHVEYPQEPAAPSAVATLHLLADDVCDAEMRYGIASWDHGFVETHLTLRLEGDELIAEDFNVFKDDSGRSNYRARYKFKKVK
jgi:hypothetical protein